MEGIGSLGGGTGVDVAAAGEVEQVVLDDELNAIAGHLNVQHARLVDVAVRLLAHPDGWQGPGVWTVEQYLCWRVGLSASRAGQVVGIARRVDELPVCVAAFGRGELAIDQMAAIAKRAPWWTDEEVCGHGKAMTVGQLRHVLARYPFPDIPNPDMAEPGELVDAGHANDAADDAADDAAASDGNLNDVGESTSTEDAGIVDDIDIGDDSGDECGRRHFEAEPDGRCGFYWDEAGRFHLTVDADGVTGAIIESALTEARDGLFNDGNTRVNWLDAIREVCDRSLDSVTDAGRRDRFRINIHLDADGAAVDAFGWRLPDAVRRYITCDGLLSPVFVAEGIPLSVGRSQRIVPERTRRQVILRDQGCRVPGCDVHKFLEVHHIIHWDDDGPTDTWNLICLCPHHHRLHHQGKLGIAGDADLPGGVSFTNLAGNPIAQTGARPRPKPPGAPPPVGTYRHPLGERLNSRWIYFNPPRVRSPGG